jgi:5'-phosphate synthase pdxT subunit
MLKLIEQEGLLDPLLGFAARKPLFGTCAGVILMARETLSPAQRSFGLIDAVVERNAYGRQAHSAIRRLQPESEFVERAGPGELEAVFIRAPIIRAVGAGVTILIKDGATPALVEQGRFLASTFHPELSADPRVHRLFVDKIKTTR